MAHTIPERPAGNVTPEVARAFKALKMLPDDWYVWFHITPWEPEVPEFLVLDAEQRALLLKVSRATVQQAQQAPQLQLLALEQVSTVPAEAEEDCLEAFIAQAVRAGVPRPRMSGGILFPNLAERDLQAIAESGTEARFAWLDKDWLNGKNAATWEELLPVQPLDAEMVQTLRGQFAPETVIPETFVARVSAHTRRLTASLTPYLLDYDQEALLKSDLDLLGEGDQLARELRVQIVNGVAGSGKTLVLLYRLRLLQASFPNKDYLVLTHNRPLIREMQARYQVLSNYTADNIDWHTFMGWCRRNWPSDQPFNPLSIRQREQLIRTVWQETLSDTAITEGMFTSELGWLKDNGIHTHEDYLEAARRGRGFRLTEGQREQMFVALRTYQQRLTTQKMMDWWDVPRRYWHWLELGEIRPPQYDVVLVDEAQFFAPLWFDIVRQLVLPEIGYLFLAADPTQGFLRRGESWKSITGLDVRGRSAHLRRSYRTTRAILTFALAFYRQRLPEDEPNLLLPELTGMQVGKPPQVICFTAPQDERARIVSEIVQAVGAGLMRRHILVLHATAIGAEALITALNQQLGEGAARDPKDEAPGEFIRVTTLNAGTGLESPVVFIAGIHELFEKEDSLRLTEDERAELVQEHTRKLYMAFTRAGQRLLLTYVGAVPAVLEALQKHGLVDLLA